MKEIRHFERVQYVGTEIGRTTLSFFRSRIIVCLIVGVLTAVGFTLIGLPFGWLLGLLIGVLNVVPILPLIFGLVPSLIIAYIHFNDFRHPFFVFLIFMIVQLLDGLVLSPLIQGKMVGLHPITTFFILLVGSFFGFLGLLLAIPVAVALKIIFKEFFRERPVGIKYVKSRDVTGTQDNME